MLVILFALLKNQSWFKLIKKISIFVKPSRNILEEFAIISSGQMIVHILNSIWWIY